MEQIADAPVLVSQDGPVATLTLNRPSKLNAINDKLLDAFSDALRAVEADNSVSAVVVRGAGKAFVAGADLDFMSTNPLAAAKLVDKFHDSIRLLTSMSKPVLVSLHGAVAGGGLALALSCDLAIAADNVRLLYAYTKLATTGDGGISYRLPRLVGMRKAIELTLIDDPIKADDALRLGLVNWVTTAETLDAETTRIAMLLAGVAPFACGKAKALLAESWNRSFNEQLDAEAEALTACSAKPEFQARIGSLLRNRTSR